MWFKKKSVLLAEGHYDTEESADGTTDLRTTHKAYTNSSSSINNSGRPSAADAGNYFFLPALGYYSTNSLVFLGDNAGRYWSSSANPDPWSTISAYYLYFQSGNALVATESRYAGFRVDWPK